MLIIIAVTLSVLVAKNRSETAHVTAQLPFVDEDSLPFSTLISRAGAAILPDEHMFVQFDVSQLMQCYGH
ncbi:hypothetical protein POPTR_007G138750v4 [Populus trichocarpa]|jgi:hypothetical protein|uniref:Uncharacterized protein n=1 Tax=Populus trichocarpa TaxID=3694 RepID=A0A3N7GKM3_POPTR|nr:hypothetical protein POPTR_007G138750v4 [Populus trichocarpa]